MKFTCDKCSAQYLISDEKVGPNGVKVRCKKCGNVVVVRRASAEAAKPAPVAAVVAPRGAEGLDAELGAAFDNAFGGGAPAAVARPAAEEDAPTPAAPEPAPPATEWYVAIGEAQVGPLPLSEVKRKWEEGDVGPDSLVWRPGMADWGALSSVGDLAAFLAPVPRPQPKGAAREEPRRADPEGQVAAAPKREAAAWTPGAASKALENLAREELTVKPAEPKPAAVTRNGARTSGNPLVDAMNLPDSGVDPTGAFELPIKGVERTEERPRQSSLARGAEELRHRRSVNRAILYGVLATLLLVAGGVALAMWYLDRVEEVAAAQPRSAPAAAPVETAPAQPAPAAKPPPEEPPPSAVAAAPAPATSAPEPASASAADPAPAEPATAPATRPAAPPAREQVAAPAKRPARTEPRPARREPARAPPRREERPAVAAAPPPAREAPAPAPAQPRNESLDFGGSDDALEEALGAGSGSGRSVYVPPRPGGTSGLPDRVTPAQINEAVAGRVDALRKCVSEQKAREPDASGVITMRWTILPDGNARDVRCVTPEYAKSPFAACIGSTVRGIRFPRSATTGQEVTFPFSF